MDIVIHGLNIAAALTTIGLGLFGWLRPTFTMEVLGLATTDDTGLGRSEIRAASGALWVGAGAFALALFSATAFVMLAGVWIGAAVGRLTAIVADGARKGQPVVFFAVEAGIGALLLALNWHALT
ncbi:MAG: DUF4345 family protein [Devosiaceae bacterium]|nr:DUF4345 family protein [Devosiaceae bacterium MH13]